MTAVVALVLFVGAVAVSYALYADPKKRAALSAASDLADLMERASRDPGAVALRAAGCDEAHAYRSDEFVPLMQRIDPGLRDHSPSSRAPAMIVSCTRNDEASCESLARTFVAAHLPPPTSFSLAVTVPSSEEPTCSGVFTETARRVRSIGVDDTHVAPSVDVRTSASRRAN